MVIALTMLKHAPTDSRVMKSASRPLGVGQLSLVEHSLCPLETHSALGPNLVHAVQYHYTDAQRRRQVANVRVFAPLGLTSGDELYLWGLLALTLSQPNSDGCLFATPHWCLRQLGLIDSQTRRGGRQYQQFSAAIERLSVVSYLSDACYDPNQAEYRRVSFGFLSYSLPVNPNSCRAWRIVWNPVFFSFVKSIGGNMRFDLERYRSLDPAARRLFLLLVKVGYRTGRLPVFDLRHLAVDLLGLSPKLALRDMKVKIVRTLNRLEVVGVLQHWSIVRVSPGQFSVSFERGANQTTVTARDDFRPNAEQSPLIEGLLALGFDSPSAVRLVRRYPTRLVAEWTDITQAALERFGARYFHKSPMAYLVDSLSKAAEGIRTPPDWWHAVRKAEQRKQEPSVSNRQLFSRLIDEVFGVERDASTTAASQPRSKRGLERAGDLLKTSF